jgi:hypothetical protein
VAAQLCRERELMFFAASTELFDWRDTMIPMESWSVRKRGNVAERGET